ncbi:DUF2490 domain-containing protein [Zobellia uliginosa]|uniref:DUF2490 domain-containing protein n=1 Tax=Zobellia uliginosa TaxID=143224 RepID=UPI0026E33EB5|nr:DUF2490 domain-containing protein [Zobellia uliginosa]MDO6517709.1 DUF2490 domain-containing protein [Zobellia uliginosa]
MERSICKVIPLLLFGLMPHSKGLAQFSPPGLGEVHTAAWLALGAKQDLGQKGTTVSSTYLGFGSVSAPNNYNPVEKPSIYVLNQEVTHRFKPHWKYALALSYRWQNKYTPRPPYDYDTPKARQELRAYGSISYLNSFKKMNYAFTYRPEVRRFYDPDFTLATESLQFRSRFKAKLSFYLNGSKTQQISTAAESLFATGKTENWSKFAYKESRFSLYYSLTLPQQDITLNMGYMNNLLGRDFSKDAHYLAFDVAINNPFHRKSAQGSHSK